MVNIRHWITLGACLVVTTAALAGSAGSADERPNAVRMGRVARAFEATQRSLTGGDSAAVHAAALYEALEHAADVTPQRNETLRAGFERYYDQARTHAGDILTSSDAQDLDAARQSLDALRRTCVSCHVKYRAPDSEAGLFPGRTNTITGMIRVTDVDGNVRDDASGIVVFVDGIDTHANPPKRPAVVSQVNRMFMPRILPVLKGTRVLFPNDDTIFHNAFSLSKTKPFDLGIYDRGESKAVVFDNPGLVRVYCNIHPSMVLNVLVLENPHFDVTDRAGLFVLPDVPDGDVVLRTWSERAGETKRTMALSGGVLHEVELSIHETEHVAMHHNKFGKPYKGKYR